jgi:TetR/AcrR family transcriptional regulator, tetracycline repressor protein
VEPIEQLRRGRPRRLSRERILDAVAEMLRGDPRAPLTMARAAEAVGASPMSLYRYFKDRDDLIVSVTRHVLRDTGGDSLDDVPWTDRVRAWMTTVYEQAVAHPQLFQMAASGESPAWLTCSARLATILESAGLADDRRLASAVYLIGSTTLGQAMVAAASGSEMTIQRLYGAIGHLTADEAARVGALIPQLADIGSSGFGLVVEATIAALTSTDWSVVSARGQTRSTG